MAEREAEFELLAAVAEPVVASPFVVDSRQLHREQRGRGGEM